MLAVSIWRYSKPSFVTRATNFEIGRLKSSSLSIQIFTLSSAESSGNYVWFLQVKRKSPVQIINQLHLTLIQDDCPLIRVTNLLSYPIFVFVHNDNTVTNSIHKWLPAINYFLNTQTALLKKHSLHSIIHSFFNLKTYMDSITEKLLKSV